MGGEDFLDEIVRERTLKTPEFSELVECSRQKIIRECITDLFVKAWYVDIVHDDFGLADDLIDTAMLHLTRLKS